MLEYRRRYKGIRYRSQLQTPDDAWIPIKQACLKLYKGPCVVILVILTLCYISLFLNEEDLQDRLKVSPERIQKVLIISYFRSGSSFLGDLLRSAPRSFYFFEPLRYFGEFKDVSNFTLARSFVSNLFNCDFELWSDYLTWARDRDVRAFQRNEPYWASCATRTQSSPCYDRSFISFYCRHTKFRVMKVTRLPIKQIFPLLLKSGDIKVVHLVRDPRATMNSRSHRLVALWCNRTKGCHSSENLCKSLSEDMRYSCLARYTYPGRLLFVRYEDLACRPMEMATTIFKFLEIEDLPEAVVRFLNIHTKRKFTGSHPYLTMPYTTKRDSPATAFAWQNTMKVSAAQRVEKVCTDVIRMLDLELVPTNSGANATMTSMSCQKSTEKDSSLINGNESDLALMDDDPALTPPCTFQNLTYTSDFLEIADNLIG